MPYVQRDGASAINGVFANPQPGYAEEFLADDDLELVAYLAPPVSTPYLNNGGIARFTGTTPPTVLENIRMAGVTRVSKGRYRATHETPMPSDQYSAIPAVFDANPRTIRVTARTANYVEVRVTDLAGAVQDPTEITIKTERVIIPS